MISRTISGRVCRGLPLLLLLALSGCGVRGLHLPKVSLPTLFTVESGHIAYVGIDGNLFVADQSESTTRLTDDAQGVSSGDHVTYIAPTWGPQGRRIVYARYLTNPADGRSTVTLTVLDWKTRKSVIPLASDSLKPFYFDWSPQGDYIAILSDTAAGNLQAGVVTSERSDSYRKLPGGSPYFWAWSKDGTKLITHTDFASGQGGKVDVIPITDFSRSLRLNEHFGLFQAPTTLPNGDVVAAIRSAGSSRLAVLNPATGRVSELGTPSSGGFLFSISPDGKLLAYLQQLHPGPETESTLRIIDLVAEKIVLSLDRFSTVAFYWSPDSTRLAVITPPDSHQIGSAYSPIESLPRVTLKVVDIANGKSWDISTFPPTQGLLSTLADTDRYQHSQTIWSPDGKHLVYTAYANDGLPGIYLSDASGGGRTTKIDAGDSASWSRE
jgi:Tol biopolymer transport system component